MTAVSRGEQERRRFQRIDLDREVRVRVADAVSPDAEFACRLADISLRGLLLESCLNQEPSLGQRVDAVVMLDEQGTRQIHVSGRVAHVGGGQVGVQVLDIDLDSVSLLRRLVEVNLDDDMLLDRELFAMLRDRA